MQFSSSSEPTTWFRDRYLDGQLTIKPPFQRKPVWGRKQKCYLIESILLELPIPEIYIQRETTADGKTHFSVVDGQQRMRTVLQFIGSEVDPKESEANKFPLDQLLTKSPWFGKTVAELSDPEKKHLYDYEFAIRYLKTNDEKQVRDMFERLNRYLEKLKPQELRNSRYTGPFVQLSVKLADDEYWAENRIMSPAVIRRMGDVEFMSELIIAILHGPQAGNALTIDQYYEEYEEYDDVFPEQRTAERLFGATLDVVKKMLPDIKETRWSNKTDFYTLFTTAAAFIRDGKLVADLKGARDALGKFEKEIATRLANERAKVSAAAIKYVRAVEKGANDKIRRANRQDALEVTISPFFAAKK
jgi:Protein of unknown function DUF262